MTTCFEILNFISNIIFNNNHYVYHDICYSDIDLFINCAD